MFPIPPDKPRVPAADLITVFDSAVPAATDADPSTWPAERLEAAKRAIDEARALAFVQASEIDQVGYLAGLYGGERRPVGIVADALAIMRIADWQLRGWK